MTKIIHYCWFGNKEKPKLIQKCISSWRLYFPDYEIKEWNESNFDIEHNLYVKQAYDAKRYAFVSDYVRFFVLEKYGGIYFDTDVEVIRDFSDLMELDAFAGFETDEYIAPGLVLYSKKKDNEIIRETREWYDKATFLDDNGCRIRMNVCSIFTTVLLNYGFKPDGSMQVCNGMVLFPKDYFCPFNDLTGVLKKTENTYAIHWYAKSWQSPYKVVRNKVSRIIHRVFGIDIREKIIKIFHKS